MVSKAMGAALNESSKVETLNKNGGAGTYQAPRQTKRVDAPRVQVNQQNSQWRKAAQENIAKAKNRAQSAMQQVHEGRIDARNTSILQRAKANADEDKVDVTLETMEAEHNHSERVSAAVHHHPEDIMPENMLGNIEDLMIKGYDGNLCFERDFIGEGLDMISRFTVPSDVPDFS